MRVIINADDCGSSALGNSRIEGFIESGLITSTTVMATGADLEGAKRLFDTHHTHISFGAHLCLDVGRPVKFSQVLQDEGYYTDNQVITMGGGEYQ